MLLNIKICFKFKGVIYNLQRKWMKLRLQPIRVYCFHHVCAEFDSESMNACDWMQIDEFKQKVQKMQQEGVKFISLTEAYNKITNDKWRNNKYAVLTFDDGYASLKEILPWLEEQHIPATLFINGKYLDGKSFRDNPKEQYLNKEELFALTSPLIEIGSHGWKHLDASKISADEFKIIIEQNIKLLQAHPRYVPFHAYTWGKHNGMTDILLQSKNIIPVYMDGMKNYREQQVIHRELLKL